MENSNKKEGIDITAESTVYFDSEDESKGQPSVRDHKVDPVEFDKTSPVAIWKSIELPKALAFAVKED